MGLSIVILAAGMGSRLKSKTPKVLHTVGGKPLLQHVLETAKALKPSNIFVVIGHGAEAVKSRFEDENITWVMQSEPKGTGDAVLKALPGIKDERVMVLYGDVPLVLPSTLAQLTQQPEGISMLTVSLEDPFGYGRIIRNQQGEVQEIVEQKDGTEAELEITEINTGFYVLPVSKLKKWLPQLTNKNANGEYYLTDVIALAVKEKVKIHVEKPSIEEEILGVNTKAQLAVLEGFYQSIQAERLMDEGLTLRDPGRFDLRGDLKVERDVDFDVNVVCEGNVSIGEGSTIGPNVVLKNVTIGKNVAIRAFSHVEEAIVKDNAIIGPFARIRPESIIEENVRVGNFVEVKKSVIGKGSKINHLSYVGDATLGDNVNVGAGTITCNYDGVNKHKTQVGNNVFIGSNTALVAPITVGDNATIGAGSTLNKDAPQDQLTVSRSPQRSVAAWKRPEKEEDLS
jgi:bifunctional UDP-N-acetylglucosamine pyrophosphorylase/glucosamine-1-phosphate N-acetyltransferase